jgi:hypothetical protein
MAYDGEGNWYDDGQPDQSAQDLVVQQAPQEQPAYDFAAGAVPDAGSGGAPDFSVYGGYDPYSGYDPYANQGQVFDYGGQNMGEQGAPRPVT